MTGVVAASEDAWGTALLDQFHGRDVPMPQLEVDTGERGPAMHPEWFFRSFDAWDWWERELLPLIESGPVLDLGAGAGRAALYLQTRGIDVTAVDSSPGAAEVCRLRGVRDVRLADLHELPEDREWAAVLLLCGNLGLGGSWDGNRRLLTELARRTAPGALLVGDTVEPGDHADIRLRTSNGISRTATTTPSSCARTEPANLRQQTAYNPGS